MNEQSYPLVKSTPQLLSILPEDFKILLRDNKVLDSFCRNFVKSGNHYENYFSEESFKVNYIACAFHWGESAQGYKFWAAIEDLWIAKLKELGEYEE